MIEMLHSNVAYGYGMAVWLLAYIYAWLWDYGRAMEQAKNFAKGSMTEWVFNVATWNFLTAIGLIFICFLFVLAFQRIVIGGIVDNGDDKKNFLQYAMQSLISWVLDGKAIQAIYSVIILCTVVVWAASSMLPERIYKNPATAYKITLFVYSFVLVTTIALVAWIAWSYVRF